MNEVDPANLMPASSNTIRQPAERLITTPQGGLTYQPAVDGLRAIAVLAVVGFHIGLPGMPGGFVGVDVFFVISGFLIINQIVAELAAGRFSLMTFYARRALRILPPYFLVLAATFAIFPFVLTIPDSFESYAKQAGLAPLMVSNFLFFAEQGYFDPSAETKPLLHTWTLAVEEQFYLFGPLLIMLVFRFGGRQFGRQAVLIGLAIAVVSFIACVQLTAVGEKNPAFYLPPLRAWEFVIGGLIGVPAVHWMMQRQGLSVVSGAIGVCAILLSFVFFDEASAFPGWRAALPAVGTGLVILSVVSAPHSALARALSLKWMVAIGLVSYAWYLWHWPALTVFRLLNAEGGLVQDIATGGVLSFGLAVLTYRFVELPVKNWRKTHSTSAKARRIVIGGVAACLGFAVIGGASAGAGYLVNQAWLERTYRIGAPIVEDDPCVRGTGSELAAACTQGEYGVLVGDSHARALGPVLAQYVQSRGSRLVTFGRGGCQPRWYTRQARESGEEHRCTAIANEYGQAITWGNPPRFAVFSFSYVPESPDIGETMAELARELTARGTRVLILGPVPRFAEPVLPCVIEKDRQGRDFSACDRPRADAAAQHASTVEALERLPSAQLRVDQLYDVFCDTQICRPYDGRRVLYRDVDHVFPSGAQRIIDRNAVDFDWAIGR